METKKVKKYEMWSAKTIFVLMLITSAATAILVFIRDSLSMFVKLEMTLAIIALGLFIFIATGLYRGVRMKKESVEIDVPKFYPDAFLDVPMALDGFFDLSLSGAIAAIVFWVLISLILSLVFPALWGGALVLFAALFWIFSRSLRVVFIKSRVCKGNLAESLKYALQYTLLYTGWIFALTIISRLIYKGLAI